MRRILAMTSVRRYPILAETQWRSPKGLSRVVRLHLQTSLDSRSLGSDDIGQKRWPERGICGEYGRGSASRFAPPRC
jgi:hypothetical protein